MRRNHEDLGIILAKAEVPAKIFGAGAAIDQAFGKAVIMLVVCALAAKWTPAARRPRLGALRRCLLVQIIMPRTQSLDTIRPCGLAS